MTIEELIKRIENIVEPASEVAKKIPTQLFIRPSEICYEDAMALIKNPRIISDICGDVK